MEYEHGIFAIAAGGGAVSVLAIDALGSFACRRFGIPYQRLMILSVVVYALVGILGSRAGSAFAGAAAAAIVGLIDSTVGWRISWLIGPGRSPSGEISVAAVLGMVVFVTALAGACGLVAGLVSTL